MKRTFELSLQKGSKYTNVGRENTFIEALIIQVSTYVDRTK
jgi:hypothetical protein